MAAIANEDNSSERTWPLRSRQRAAMGFVLQRFELAELGSEADADLLFAAFAARASTQSNVFATADTDLDGVLSTAESQAVTQYFADAASAALDQTLRDSPDPRRTLTELLSVGRAPFLDANTDGQLDTADLVDFLLRVNAGHPSADLNSDGTVDDRDIQLATELIRAG